MKIKDILKCQDREVIDSVKGIIVSVETPNRPSEKQEKAGIHVQRITLHDMEGQPLELQLMKPDLHLKPDVRGMILYARSTDGDRGPSGLTTNVYQGKCSLSVWGDAVFELLDPPANLPAAAKQGPAKQAQSSSSAYATPTREAALDAYFGILFEVNRRINDSEAPGLGDVLFSDIKEIATTLFIEGQKSGWLYRTEVVATVSTESRGVQPEDHNEPPFEVDRDPGLPAPAFNKEELVQMIVQDAVDGTLHSNIQEAEDAMKGHDLTWDNIYDEIQTRAEAIYEVADIHAAYDNAKKALARSGSRANQNVSRAICLDWTTFMEDCAAAAKINNQEIPV